METHAGVGIVKEINSVNIYLWNFSFSLFFLSSSFFSLIRKMFISRQRVAAIVGGILHGVEVRLTTTTTTSTTTPRTTTTVTSTMRTTMRRKVFVPFTSPTTTTTTEEATTEAHELMMMPTEYEIEFVTDYPGSHSLFYPGVESYQHHINYISSQQSWYDSCCRLLHCWMLIALLLFNVLITSSWSTCAKLEDGARVTHHHSLLMNSISTHKRKALKKDKDKNMKKIATNFGEWISVVEMTLS